MKNKLILASIVLCLSACGKGFVEDEIINEVVDNNEPEIAAIVEDEKIYESESYDFYNDTNLSKDEVLSSRVVTFKSGSVLKIYGFKFDIEADTINFEEGSKIVTYGERDFGDCFKNGNPGGELSITAETVTGNVELELSGSRAGFNGLYKGVKLVSSHKKVSGFWSPTGCKVYYKNSGPGPLEHLMVPMHGGSGGRVIISATNTELFNYLKKNKKAEGSLESIFEGITKGSTSWWRTIPMGSLGTLGKVCFSTDRGELCD